MPLNSRKLSGIITMNELNSSVAAATIHPHVKPVKKPGPIPANSVPSREHLLARLMWLSEPNEADCWIWKGAVGTFGYGKIQVNENGQRIHKTTHRLIYELLVGPIPEGLCCCHRCDVPACINPAHLFIGTHADNIADRDEKGRTAKGERSGAKIHPERMTRGDKHWTRQHPELMAHGDDHWTHRNPEKLARGDNAGLRKHPERAARGDRNGSRLHPELLNPPRGSSHWNSKLDEAKVVEIRKLHALGELTQREIAVRYSITQTLVSMVVRRVIWAHVK